MKMTNSHKEALAEGRAEGRIVREYLELVEKTRPRRGRQRTSESITLRLAKIEQALITADPVLRIRLLQERMNLTSELRDKKSDLNRQEIEMQFIKVALRYSKRHQISYKAWREFGIDENVLAKAKIRDLTK
jgi:hypothetical protein